MNFTISTLNRSPQLATVVGKSLVKGPTLLHEFFDQAAQRWPERIAIEVPPSSTRPNRRQMTYAELKRQSDALAQRLRGVVQQECVVAILLARNCEHLYLAQLAVLKSGAAYTCIDPAFPDGQVQTILEDSQAVALLTDDLGLDRVRPFPVAPPLLLNVLHARDRRTETPLIPADWLTPEHLAYIIYTSGTTGRPKGVMIEHRGIVNLVRGDLQELGVLPQDRVGQSSSPAYDSSVEETWFALAAGATVVVMDDETTRLGPDLVPWLRRERITMFCPPPTLLRATGCDHPEQELPNLRLVHVGGEALPTDVAERWALGRRLVNDYGPTETTVTALRGRIEAGTAVTIGQPVPGMKAWVLNEALEEVADGELGELCLGGVGLARGYMNEPELTARKFPRHPRLGRIYRSGDLVHRDAAGNFFCHGRIDAQVKIRGYRIELEAIEARLLECAGVRAAACRAQGEGSQQRLVAFVVAEPDGPAPAFDDLKQYLRTVLPEYMVPSRFGLLAQLPTTVSGKLNRKALPILEALESETITPAALPCNDLEKVLESACRHTLRLTAPVSMHHDFFNDLGGDSLLAAQFISRLRDDPTTAALTVRDLYEVRTLAELAKRAKASGQGKAPVAHDPMRPVGRPLLATCLQTLWLLLGLVLGGPLAYLTVFQLLPALTHSLGLVPLLLLAPILFCGGLVVYTSLTVALAVLVKKLLIGQYRPLSAPVWGSFYVRNWMVQQVVRLLPWRLLEGTVFQIMILRALGARIGQRVHLHRGVHLLQGGWDLLDLGDDVTLSQDAALRLVELADGQIIVAGIRLESGCTLDIRACVAGHTHMEAEAYLTAASFLPSGSRVPYGERWEGVPAQPAGRAAAQPTLSRTDCQSVLPAPKILSPTAHGLVMLLGQMALLLFLALPLEILALAFALATGVDVEHLGNWFFQASQGPGVLLLGLGLILLAAPLTLIFEVIAMRLLGRVQPGVISRWSLAYVRVWLKTGIVESASHWLSGSLLWPVWLRWAGMKIGCGSEVSTIIDTVPELVTIGTESFFADGIYLAGPVVHRGTVTLATVQLGQNTFLGNHAIVGAGQQLPENVLLGVCTVADDRQVRPGTSWFGHPPFELPKREVVACDRSLTHHPNWIRYLNRVFWELLRFALPLAPMLFVCAWLQLVLAAETTVSLPVLLLVVVPLLDLGMVAALCLLTLALKWLLLGRVRPGVHPLYSCWCCRWDFFYVVWDMYAHAPLTALEGTLLLSWYVRAMGSRVGRNVVLGHGFAHVVDPDMLEFEDGATVNCQFQAHTFEDRVLKIDHVKIRRQATVGYTAVLLYGADIGERTHVAPNSVVMKRERLLAGRSYAGCPTRPLNDDLQERT